MVKKIKNELFICKGLPEFEKFTPESIQNEFPKVLDNLEKDFKHLETFFEKLLTDQKFHALAIPPFGPGRTRRFDPYVRDVGRMAETDRIEDSYRFRTPSLRNVALTAPYGHNGAFPDLDGIIRHHLNPSESLREWKREWAKLPSIPWLTEIDFLVWDDRFEMKRFKSKIDIQPIALSDDNIADLVSFMHALTGQTAQKLRFGIPERVPSGLPIDK